MFMGQYEHSIDPKGRLMIPVKYRDFLSEGAVVTKGFDQNLMVLSKTSFEEATQRITEFSITQTAARQLQRQMFSFAVDVTLDKLGRILIPSFLRENADLKESVIVAGMSSYFEVWSPERWQQQLISLDNQVADEQRYAAFNLPIR